MFYYSTPNPQTQDSLLRLQEGILLSLEIFASICYNFCLLNSSGEVQRISYDTFNTLKPDAIVLLTEEPGNIVSRRRKRDGIEITIESVEKFQREERRYADEVAKNIGAKLFISKGAEDLIQAIGFIKSL